MFKNVQVILHQKEAPHGTKEKTNKDTVEVARRSPERQLHGDGHLRFPDLCLLGVPPEFQFWSGFHADLCRDVRSFRDKHDQSAGGGVRKRGNNHFIFNFFISPMMFFMWSLKRNINKVRVVMIPIEISTTNNENLPFPIGSPLSPP